VTGFLNFELKICVEGSKCSVCGIPFTYSGEIVDKKQVTVSHVSLICTLNITRTNKVIVAMFDMERKER
jgi:hypothetical protein